MGRGAPDQALRLSALPRRLASPKRVGQKRYRLGKTRGYYSGRHVVSNEPGYLHALTREFSVYSSSSQGLILKEEVAARDKDGKLSWIPGKDLTYDSHMSYSGVSDLHYARSLVDKLNKRPLGPFVDQSVDDQGNLRIGHKVRNLDRRDGVKDFTVEEKSFDVSDPKQAAEARTYHQDLTNKVSAEEAEGAYRAVVSMRAHRRPGAENFFADEQAAERGKQAERFAEALEKGQVDQLDTPDKGQVKEQANRASETIRSLSGI